MEAFGESNFQDLSSSGTSLVFYETTNELARFLRVLTFHMVLPGECIFFICMPAEGGEAHGPAYVSPIVSPIEWFPVSAGQQRVELPRPQS